MKYIKTYRLFESSDEKILDFLIFLEDLGKTIDEKNNEFYAVNFRVKHNNGNIINIEFDWSTPEEGGDTFLSIDLDKLTIRDKENASTVYGSYENDNTYTFESIDAMKKFLTNQFK